MLQWIANLLTNPVSSSLIGAIVGFVASFFAQDWLENRKFKRTIKMKTWESKVGTLRQFSEDLELWFYLTILENNQEWSHDSRPQINEQLSNLIEKLVRTRNYLLNYPNILSHYEQLLGLIEQNTLNPIYLAPEEIGASRSLLKDVQKEIQKEINKLTT